MKKNKIRQKFDVAKLNFVLNKIVVTF